MSELPPYRVLTGRVSGDDENMRTALVILCDAVGENGEVRDGEALDAIKNDVSVNHRDLVEPHTVVFVQDDARPGRVAPRGRSARRQSDTRRKA